MPVPCDPKTPTGRAWWLCTTPWPKLEPSPVVLLNRAVAVGMAQGPAAGLAAIEALEDHAALQRYPWFYSVRAEWLEQLGHRDRARADWTTAASLTDNEADRALLLRRAREDAGQDGHLP